MGMCCREYTEEGIEVLQALLGLEGSIISITFIHDVEEYERSSEQEFKASLSYCSMVRLTVKGHGRKGVAVHMSCLGVRRSFGLDPVNEEYLSERRYLWLGIYADLDQAARIAAVVSRIESPIYSFAVKPLQMCTQPPHVDFVLCDAYQAMRLVQGYAYPYPDLWSTAYFGNQGVYAELTVRAHVSGRPNVSLLRSNTRYSCAWGDGEVGFCTPFSMFKQVIDGVLATLNATEPDGCKRDIAARASAAGLDVKPCLGEAYFFGLATSSDTNAISKEAGAS